MSAVTSTPATFSVAMLLVMSAAVIVNRPLAFVASETITVGSTWLSYNCWTQAVPTGPLPGAGLG